MISVEAALWIFLLGVFVGMLAGVMVYRVLPHINGWREIQYNIYWTDAWKRFRINRDVKWEMIDPKDLLEEPPPVWRLPKRPNTRR